MGKQRKKPVEMGERDCLTVRCPRSTELQEKQCAHLFTQHGESASIEKKPELKGLGSPFPSRPVAYDFHCNLITSFQ